MNLVHAYSPAFAKVLSILERDGGPEGMNPGEAKRQVAAELDQATERASAYYDAKTLFLARRLVTAWADERLSSDAWSGREEWLSRPLQSDWLEGRRSGEWFFETAETLDPGRPDHGDLAALCLRCLSLGLDGRLHDNGEEMVALRQSLTRRFNLDAPANPFPPPLAKTEQPGGRARGRAFAGAVLAIMLGLVVFFLAGESRLAAKIAQTLPDLHREDAKP